MRTPASLLLLVFVAACNVGGGTQPSSTRLDVRVRDDIGAAVDRMPVTVTFSSGERVSTRTGSDGKVAIDVPDGGTYQVTVIPRVGFIGGVAGLSKAVTVDERTSRTVDFTVHRAGMSTGDHPG